MIPIAFVAYFPALYVLDKDDPLGLPRASSSPRLPWRSLACVAGGSVAERRPPLPERGRVIELDRRREDVHRARQARPAARERREVRAVDGVSFAIEAGELVGYVGPNGAGKSTTVKMLTGILVPSGGRISVAGLDPSRQRIELARRIGVVFGQRVQLWWDLPLRDSFELLRHIYRVPADRYRANLGRLPRAARARPFLETPVRQLSLGQRMRGELTAAMLHDPEILFLDEPTIGLDVVAKARVREFLTRSTASAA